MSTPKWNDERVATLEEVVSGETPVSRATVELAAEKLETSTRSVASKLRKLGHEVEKASEAPKAFSDEATEALRTFVEENAGKFTYAEIAENFPGDYTPRAIQGKILSMELTGSIKETPKPESTKTYTDAEEAQILELIEGGAYVEEIAEALGKSVKSIRGKALSMHRAGVITSVPKQKNVKGPAADPLSNLNVSDLTVDEIAEKIGKTPRGVKTMLTRRELSAKDYDGAEKAAKKAAADAS